MRAASWVVAIFAITIGVMGIVSPDGLTTARRHLLDTPGAFYIAGSIHVAMGLVLFLFAPRSKAPKILRVLGAIMALQGIVPQFLGIDHAHMILEQEVMLGVAALRIGAVVALATGCFIAFVITPRPRIAKR